MTEVNVMAPEELLHATRTPALVRVPPMPFLMVDGEGDPNTSPAYAAAIQALYGLSYTLKFMLKKQQGLVVRVGPLEGLWWSEDMAVFETGPAPSWRWTSMIAQPDAVSSELVEVARGEVVRKRGVSAALSSARLQTYAEGLCAQVLHVGPFSAEGPSIMKLHTFIAEQGLAFDGRVQRHHEIYLSDIRRAAPERWRTVLRQPVSEPPPAQS